MALAPSQKLDTAQPSNAPATILLVDDSAVNLQVLVRTLDGTGHRVLAATNGKAAMDIAERVHPDLILLDVMMPEMDGLEVCRRLKANTATRDIAIIFLSALGEVADKVAGLNLGAADYITKPIQAAEVLARIANHLAIKRLEHELRDSRDRLNEELASAAEMQRMILPHPIPQIAGLRFAARYETSRHVGGDYYDILRLPEGRCGVFVSDVSGHGAPSAIVMAMVRAVLHALPAPAVDPAETLLAINRHFKFLWESGILVTVFYAVVDPAGKSATVACAGHPPPLLRRNGAVSVVQYEPTIPLLLMDLAHVPVTTIALNAGDELLIYTDGITERAGPADSMYEVDRLQAALLSAPRDSADHTLQHVTADVERFAAGQESADDQTLLLMVVTPEA